MQKVELRTKLQRRKLRVRKKVDGTAERPRVSVSRSNNYTYGQIIDDVQGKTLAALSLNEVKKLHEKTTKSDAAKKVGLRLAEVAKENKITKVVFDRSGHKYHGRIKEFADGLREGGLNF